MKIRVAPLGQLGANFYLICDEASGEAMAIDPGADAPTAIDLVKQSGCTLKYIVLTHAHADHIGALDALKTEFSVPVVIGKYEATALNSTNLNLCYAFGAESPCTSADILVSDGDKLTLGEHEVQFIHTPGHTTGGICILFEDSLISGDTLFRASIGRTDFPGGSFSELESSIKNKIYTLPLQTKIYPGHGEQTTVEYEMKYNPYVRGN